MIHVGALARSPRTLATWAALALAVQTAACADLLTFEVPADTTVDVPGSGGATNPLAADQVFPPGALNDALNEALAQSFSTQSIDKDAVSSLKLTEMRLVADDAVQNGNQVRGLGFIERASFALGSKGKADAAITVASSPDGAFDGAPPGPAEVSFTTTGAELAPTIQAGDDVAVTGDVVPRSAPRISTTLHFFVTFTVVANPFGVLNGDQSKK